MAAKRATTGHSPAKKAAADAAPAAPAYVVFARRFRPQSFSEVVGQNAVTGALRQALTSGRVAQAYLLCGPRGVGKTSLARILAKALNCLKGTGPSGAAEEPCNECEACRSIQEGRALDVIEMDAATNRGIEEVRTLRENVGIAPAQLRCKVYIIDEVHMLTREAWNAFLKTLEEPPAHVKFVFATTDPNNVPETILSRCQRFDLRRIGPADTIKRLKQICGLEKIEFEEAALTRIASLARGGLRDAEGLLDQAVNLGEGKITDAIVRDLSGAAPDELLIEILTHCAQGRTGDALLKAQQALEAGADPEDMLEMLSERTRGALLAEICGLESPLLESQAHLKPAYAELGKVLSEDQCLMLIQLFAAARRQMRDAAQTRLPLEMALIRAARASELVDLSKLIGALESARPGTHPPEREGPRPNSPGRLVGNAESPTAARPNPNVARPSFATPLPARSSAPPGWADVVAAARAQKGGVFLASALSYAVVQLEVSTGKVALTFRPEQDVYLRALQQRENQAALQAIFRQVFKRTLTLTVRGAGAEFQAAPVPEPDEPEPGPETESDFVEAGTLPLPPTAPAGETEDAPPTERGAKPIAPADKPAAPEGVRLDAKSVESHPLVQMVLNETGGMILEVLQSRTAARNSAKEGLPK